MTGKDPILTPELIKILKIFGLASVGIVLVFSFFDGYRAQNSQEKDPASVSDANLLYFKNLRQAYYDREVRAEEKLEIFRYKKREKNENSVFINLSIIISRIRSKAYVFIEPSEGLQIDSSVKVRWLQGDEIKDTLGFELGDRISHLRFVQQIYPLIDEADSFQVQIEGKWLPILRSEKSRNAFARTTEDYLQLINKSGR